MEILLIALQRGLSFQGAMNPLVIQVLHPYPEPGVQLIEITHGLELQLPEKLISNCAVPAFYFTLGFGLIGLGINEVDSQPRTEALKGVRTISRTIIDQYPFGEASFEDRLFEHPLNIPSAVSPVQNAQWAISREASSISETR